jgi:hypothetical protein
LQIRLRWQRIALSHCERSDRSWWSGSPTCWKRVGGPLYKRLYMLPSIAQATGG